MHITKSHHAVKDNPFTNSHSETIDSQLLNPLEDDTVENHNIMSRKNRCDPSNDIPENFWFDDNTPENDQPKYRTEEYGSEDDPRYKEAEDLNEFFVTDERSEEEPNQDNGFQTLSEIAFDEETEEEEEEVIEAYAEARTDVTLTSTPIDLLNTLSESIESEAPIMSGTTEAAGVGLLAILQRANAPLSLFPEITDWVARNADTVKKKPLPSRSKLIDQLSSRYNLHSLRPRIEKHYLPTRKDLCVDLVIHDFNAILFSLLTDAGLMRQENLLIDLDNPTAITPENESSYVGDYDTASDFHTAHRHYIKLPNQMLICLMFFIDGTHLTNSGSIKMEPVFVTLTIFNRETRLRPEAWRVVGYIKNQSQVAFTGGTKNDKLPTPGHDDYVPGNLRDYHSMLGAILSDVKKVQATGFKWRFKGKQVDVISPTIAIMGDTLGHDKVCCLRGGNGNKNPPCRNCLCSSRKLDDPMVKAKPRNARTVNKLLKDKLFAELRRVHGIYAIENGFHGILFCNPSRGIYGACPAEILHYIQKGWYEYGLKSFYNLQAIGGKNAVWVDSFIYIAEGKCLSIGLALQRQSDRSLPRTYFPSGYFPKKGKSNTDGKRKSLKRNAQEIPGLTLVTLLFLLSYDAGNDKLKKRMGEDRERGFIHVFDLLLTYEAWLKQPRLLKTEVRRGKTYIQKMMKRYKEVISRSMMIRKFHFASHQCDDILRLGSPLNFTGHVGESNFKTSTKRTYLRTQKREATVEFQTATRHTEQIVISRACSDYGITSGPFWGGLKPTMTVGRDTGATLPQMGSGLRTGFHVRVTFKNARGPPELDDDDVSMDSVHYISVRLEAVRGGPLRRLKKRTTKSVARYFEVSNAYILSRWTSEVISLDNLKSFLLYKIYPSMSRCGTAITLFTEYMKEGQRYRAHPWYEKRPWHDWAYVKNSVGDRVPCHLLVFVSIQGTFEEGVTGTSQDNQSPFSPVERSGLYAIVHYVPECPFEDRTEKLYDNNDDNYRIEGLSTLTRWTCKVSKALSRDWKLKGNRKKDLEPYIELVPVSDICGTCIAIRDLPNPFHNTWIFVLPRTEWANVFSTRIENGGRDEFATCNRKKNGKSQEVIEEVDESSDSSGSEDEERE